MTEVSHRYSITAYSEWETLDVEAECPDDQRAVAKARRYGSLQHMRGLPSVIFAHVVFNGEEGPREVGTWEYRIRATNPGVFWHDGPWPDRPMPEDRPAMRRWAASFSNGR